MEYGFFDGMDFEQYAAIPAINYSSLKHMMRSPLCYRYHLDNPQQPSPQMILGSATHRVILEPDRCGDFAVWGCREEEKVRRGKVWDAFQAEHAGSFIVTEAERDAMVGMAVAVRKNEVAAKYLKSGRSEVSMVWRDKATGRDFKGRIDRLTEDDKGPLVIDLKTTRDSRPWRFGNEAYRLGYPIQFAMYLSGVYTLTSQLPRVKVIAPEQKAPHETVVFNVPDDVLANGQETYARLMLRLIECERTNTWPADLDYETDLTLPTYAYGYDQEDDLTGLELVAN